MTSHLVGNTQRLKSLRFAHDTAVQLQAALRHASIDGAKCGQMREQTQQMVISLKDQIDAEIEFVKFAEAQKA